jgi:hypothetical protein
MHPLVSPHCPALLLLLHRTLQDVQLQNAGAWANLTAAPGGGAAAPAAPVAAAGGAGEAAAGAAAPAEDDNLWTEFQGREAQQLQVCACASERWCWQLR